MGDTNMTITKITYYDEMARKSVTPPKEQWDYWATAALYNVYTISGAANHAVTHIFHYILVTGIHHSTKHDESLRTWAEPYMQNCLIDTLMLGSLWLNLPLALSSIF